MKASNFTSHLVCSSLLCLLVISLPLAGKAQFQRHYGNTLDNSLSKVIKDGNFYYVLGQDEPTEGALHRATVTRLNSNGVHQWTLSMATPSIWADAVLLPGGDLMVVGYSLPFDATTKSIIGRVTQAGAFSWLKSYNQAGRDFFNRVVAQAGSYYVLAGEPEPMSSQDNVALWNFTASGTLNWKKYYISSGDDEFVRDLVAIPGGGLLMAGNDANGVIYTTDNNGDMTFTAVTIGNRVYRDVEANTSGGYYAAATNFPSGEGYLEKFDADLLLMWEVKINELNSISQVWEGLPGDIYVTGSGTFGGQLRTVVIKLIDDVQNGPSVSWVKYLTAGTGQTGGSSWYLPPNQMAYTDARVLPGGFGETCGNISVSDLEMSDACDVASSNATLLFTDPVPNGPLPYIAEQVPAPTPVNIIESSSLNWLEGITCSDDPCAVDLQVTHLNDCGLVEVCAISSGPGPYTYQWCDGSTGSCVVTQLPCGSNDFCVSVTCSDGTTVTTATLVQVSDIVPPAALCVSGFSVLLNANCTASITAADVDNGSFDNCQIVSKVIDKGTFTQCGIFPVTLTVTDWCGNQSTCTTNVAATETTPPTIVCPPTYSTECNVDIGPDKTGFATATDNCTATQDITITYTDELFSLLNPLTETLCDNYVERTWKATDKCGNMSTCIQTISVHDDVKPVLADCPNNMIVVGTLDTMGVCTANVQVASPTVTDNCDPSPTLSNSFNGTANASGVYPNGSTTVTWTASDVCGNVATCEFVVTVECETEVSEKCGWTVATCYANNPADPVAVIYDTRFNASAIAGTDWGTTLNPGAIHPPSWNANIIGNVFGIALDAVHEKIFLAATDVYKLDAGYLNSFTGSGGSAGIYKTDCASPYSTVNIVSTQNSPTISSISGTMLPNTGGVGNGLGNICYDEVHNQLFASNLEDGRIYRIDPNGNILSAYDPLTLDNGLYGRAPVWESVWAVGYNRSQNRIYFAVEGLTPGAKYVYSVGLTATGEFSATPSGPGLFVDPTPASILTAGIPGNQKKFTDIAFSQQGNLMLLSERGFPHDAGVFEYQLVGTSWIPSTNNFYVGPTVSSPGRNSAGGVDYGYKEQGGKPTAICDGYVWATGNYLMTASNKLVYGLEGILASGNPLPLGNSSTDIFIDYDGVYTSSPKNQIGDVELFKCGCPGQASVCDSISIASMPFNDMGQDTCCFKLTVDNQKPNYFTAIQLCTGGGVSFSNVTALNGCVLNSYFAGQVTVVPPGGIPNYLPVGIKDFVKFCLSNYQTVPTQQVIVKYYGPDFEVVCTDTLNYNCTQKPKCLKLTPEVTCGPNGTFNMDFCVMADALMSFNVGSFTLNPPKNSNITFTPNSFTPNPTPLTPSSMQCGFTTNITGALDGQTFCFSVTAHQQNIVIGEPLLNCCTDTVMLVCVTMPDCVCDKLSADTISVSSPDGECCWKLNLTNNYSNTYFTGVQLEICTPGVVFGAINNPGFVWNLASGPTLATFKPLPGPFIGASAALPTFCLSGITSPTQVPQIVVLKWLGPNMQVVCTDTILFHCQPPDTSDCAELVCPKVECDKDIFGVYNLSFQIQNNSGFTVNQVNLNNVTGCGLLTNTQFSISPLPNGNISGSLATQIMGCAPGQQICFYLTVHEIGSNGSELNCCTRSEQYCLTLHTCGFCPGNLVQNGDFEIGVPSPGDEDIFLAQSWSGIWNDGPFPVSTADFWNTGTFNNPIIGTIPLPLSQSNYAGIWCKLNPNQVWREGILNQLIIPVSSNTGSYDFEMKVACLSPVLPLPTSVLPSLSIYGVDVNSVSTGVPGGLAPANTGLFSGPPPVLLKNIVLPSTCDKNFSPVGFNFNSNILPAGFQMDRIFITRTDGVASDIYLGIDDVCLKPADTCCHCGTFFDITYRPIQGAPNIPAECNDTLMAQCNGTIPWSLGGNFLCDGNSCPDSTQMYWMLMGPNVSTNGGAMVANPGFSVSIPASNFNSSGYYNLTLKAICGQDTCYCNFVVDVKCDSCCTGLEAFCDRLDNNVSLTVDIDLCKATLNIGNLIDCDEIEYVDWGDGNQDPNLGAMTMHPYAASGTYSVCYLATEKDTNGLICFEKIVCDTITLVCDSCECAYDPVILTKGDSSYQLGCNIHGAQDLELGCPATDITISGFFGCKNSATGEPCDETDVWWQLDRPANLTPITGTTNNYPIFFFQASDISVPGLYCLTRWTICPGSTDTCVCKVRWVQLPCDSCACSEGEISRPSLVVNGNFGYGDNYFASSLTPNTGPNQCFSNSYLVSGNFQDKCAGWPNVNGRPDGSLSTNNCLIVDGNSSGSATIWSQQVSIMPCSNYCFSFWTASAYPNPPQSFNLDVIVFDGSGAPIFPIVGTQNIVQTSPPWSQHSFTWTCPCNASGPFTIAIVQTAGDSFADFGIDDICFTKSCDDNLTDDGLMGYFPFYNNANDLSITGVSGVVHGATVTNGHDNAPNSAYHFNGTSDWIDCGTNNRGIDQAVTVGAWVRTNEMNNGQWVAGKYKFEEDKGYVLSIGNGLNQNVGQVSFGGRDGTSGAGVGHSSGWSPTFVNDNAWHCLVGKAADGIWSVYVDGVLESSAPGSTIGGMATSATIPFTIGYQNPTFPVWMNGDIDNVVVYNRAMTDEEISCFCSNVLPSDTCTCLGFEDLNFYYEDIFVDCNNQMPVQLTCPTDTVGAFFLHGNLHCSDSCAISVDWEILDSNSTSVFSGTESVQLIGNGVYHFDLPTIAYSNFPGPGTYQLKLKGHCGSSTCECVVTFIVPDCESCCTDFLAFTQAMNNGISVIFDQSQCKATLNIGDLPCDDYVDWINWGEGPPDNTDYPSGSMPMHTYANPGTYTITWHAIEKNANGQECFQADFTKQVTCPGCAYPPVSIQAWWQMEEQNGDPVVYDFLGLHNGTPKPNGTIGSGNGPDPVLGKVNGALNFISPGNTHVEVSSSTSLNFGSGSFAIDAWIKTDMGTQTEPIVDKLGTSNSGYAFSIQGTSPANYFPTLVLGMGSSPVQVLQGTTPIVAGEWNFVAVSVCPPTVTFFVGNSATGGSLVQSTATISGGTPNASNSLPMRIGYNPQNLHWNIAIDELEIFNACLSFQDFNPIWLADEIGKCTLITNCFCAQLESAVDSGFVSSVVGNQEYSFHPVAMLSDCDTVTWHWGDGTDDTVSTGSDSVTHEMTPANYYIKMTVMRTEPSGDTCSQDYSTTLTGLDIVVDEGSIRLFPNPTSGSLTLQFKGATPKAGQLQVLDLWGRVVQRETLIPGQQEHSFNLAILPPSVYFVKVLDDGVPVWVEKVVKQ